MIRALWNNPTPSASLGSNGGSQHPDKRSRGGHSVQLHDVLEHLTPADAASLGRGEGWTESAGIVGRHDAAERGCPTPTHTAHNGPVRAGSAWDGRPGPTDCGNAAMSLLPTPRATRGGSGAETVELLPTPTTRDSKGHNQRHDDTCLTGALLPTPSVADATGGHERRGGARGGELLLKGIASHEQFGKYAPAIARWQAIFGHPAPSPTEPGKHGKPRLNAEFASWMMGIEPGWVTQVPGLTRNQQLHAIGNGVVPAQAAEALSLCLERLEGLDAA